MRTLLLTFFGGLVASALGWVTVGQVAITVATEIIVAIQLGHRRAVVSEGPVLMAKKLRYQVGDRTIDHPYGTTMTPQERAAFAGSDMSVLLSTVVVFLTGSVVLVTRGALWPQWWQVLAWLAWTAWLVATTWREHTDWMASDARLTADPSSHTYGAGTRVFSLFCVAMICGFVPWGPFVVGLLGVGEVLALRHVQGRERAVAALLSAQAPSDTGRTTGGGQRHATPVNLRLPAPDPHWTPAPGWTPPAGWYGPVPGWERQPDGTWRRTPEHPLHGTDDTDVGPAPGPG